LEEKRNDAGGRSVAIGFVLIHVSPSRESEVFNKLLKIPEVIEIHSLFGKYDIIAKIEAKNYEHLGEIVIQKIRKIDGILYTSTLTGLKFR
jgi:DNA-binding Lrp family transcriptional regulator